MQENYHSSAIGKKNCVYSLRYSYALYANVYDNSHGNKVPAIYVSEWNTYICKRIDLQLIRIDLEIQQLDIVV